MNKKNRMLHVVGASSRVVPGPYQPVHKPIRAALTEEIESLRLMRVPDAAELLGVSDSKLYDMIRKGEFPAVHVRRNVRVTRTAVAEYIAHHEAGGYDDV